MVRVTDCTSTVTSSESHLPLLTCNDPTTDTTTTAVDAPPCDTKLTPGGALASRWWNTNLPPSQWTVECPEYLTKQSEKNKNIIATLDKDFRQLSWEEVKTITRAGQIWLFGRIPSELRRYEKYCYDLKLRYGSILYYMQHERLRWPTINPSGDPPFTNQSDYKILFNDWPYALDPAVKHLIIWTKFAIGEEDEAGYLTPESTRQIEQYIVETFCSVGEHPSGSDNLQGVPREHLVWFKNYKSLRSVHALGTFTFMPVWAGPVIDNMLTKDRTSARAALQAE